MAARTANKDKILTVAKLAQELSITEAEALALMKRDDFPATRVTRDTYVVERGLLEQWIERGARRVEGINKGIGTMNDFFDFPEFDLDFSDLEAELDKMDMSELDDLGATDFDDKAVKQ